MPSPGLVRTLRIRSHRKSDGLGFLTTALGDAGAAVGEITTVRIGHQYVLREFQLLLEDETHLAHVLRGVESLVDSDVVAVIDAVSAMHEGGKIRTQPQRKVNSLGDLYAAFSPGVREIVQRITNDESAADLFTSRLRTVAIVSDGTGLLGVGKVPPVAMLPVLEGKATLLSTLAGLSSLCLPLDVESEDALISVLTHAAPAFGAILLDSVAAPRGPRCAVRLAERLKIPVFHDDADSPAVVALAAVINACKRTGLDLQKVQVGQVGLGTAGGSIARLLMRYLQRPVLGDDVHPAALSRHISCGGKACSLEEIMARADVVIANTGHGGVIPVSLVRKGQVIIALSEPEPEIEPHEAILAGAAYAADGRTISLSVAFPGVLLGALSVKAKMISDDMKTAAAVAMAEAADDDDLVPTPFSEGLHAKIACAVARAAVQGKVHSVAVAAETLTPAFFSALIQDKRVLGAA